MREVDAIDLYDLSEAGRLLLKDPVRLAREARLQRIPSTRVDGALHLPRAWVDAEAGRAPVDAEALRDYWRTRLAPPSPDGHRARRARDRLPAETLLTPTEAARRLLCDERALHRLALEHVLPPLRVDGAVRYDGPLVDLLARQAAGADPGPALAARHAEVAAWARFEYAREVELPQNRVGPALPAREAEGPAPAARAYEIPEDLGLASIEPLEQPPGSSLAEAEGFETVDEDD